MNYRHAFHAGNFADVFKHVILTRILAYLMRKEAPLRVIDTHAGTGWYDLAGEEATRTGEWRNGVGRLAGAEAAAETAALLEHYMAIAAPVAGGDALRRYPGSPAIAAQMLRPTDRMIFCELHPDDCRTLTGRFVRDRRVKVVPIDGYTALRAYVPPVERRGLVLVDPPFEQTDEFSKLARAVCEAWRKWPTGIYAIWYPIKAPEQIERFYNDLADAGIGRLLRMELAIRQIQAQGPLSGSGLAIVNPPYVLADEARTILPFLKDVLAQGPGAQWRVDWAAGDGE